jgi:hypothetical protein
MFFKSRSLEKKPFGTGKQKLQLSWREPLIHFFILGLAVTGLHAALNRLSEAPDENPYLVEVSSADIEWLWTIFKKQMGLKGERDLLKLSYD